MNNFNMERFGNRYKKEWELRSSLTKVNTDVYCARTYTVQGHDLHASTFHRDIERVFEEKAHRWSKEMRKYTVVFKRIEMKLNSVYEQNKKMQKKIKKINEKPNQHANDIQLLLYLEWKKRSIA